MKLHFPQPPARVAEHFQKSFVTPHGREFFAWNSAAHPAVMATLPETAAPIQPHQAFTIRADRLLSAHPLAAATSLGWRSLSMASDGTHGARLVKEDAAESNPGEFNIGPYTKATSEQVNRLMTMEADGEFEVRFLLVPSVYVAAIWLHGLGHKDHVLVLQPAPPNVPTNELMTEEQFAGHLQRLAGRAEGFKSLKRP